MSRVDRCYQILGLTPGATPQEIKQAYRDLAKVWHPDRFSGDPRLQAKAQEQFKLIHSAYSCLSSGQTAAGFPSMAQKPQPATSTPRQNRSTSTRADARSRSAQISIPYDRFIAVAKVIAMLLFVLMIRGLLELCLELP